MKSYRIKLRETRLAKNCQDDVALFDVTLEADGEMWRVASFLSPLFRRLYMDTGVGADERRDMVAGLGMRAIVEKLRGPGIRSGECMVFAIDYPGAPEAPAPLMPYDDVTVGEPAMGCCPDGDDVMGVPDWYQRDLAIVIGLLSEEVCDVSRR